MHFLSREDAHSTDKMPMAGTPVCFFAARSWTKEPRSIPGVRIKPQQAANGSKIVQTPHTDQRSLT